jgi:hypothetical protein
MLVVVHLLVESYEYLSHYTHFPFESARMQFGVKISLHLLG